MIHNELFIGLGSNLGDRLAHLTRALEAIAHLPDTQLLVCSSVYETEPVGYRSQDDFLNLVAHVATDLGPPDFLRQCWKIESEIGRRRDRTWGPRTIDIDLLYWGSETISTPLLKIPHPEAEKRGFVLIPLHEIAPEFRLPPQFRRAEDILQNLSDQSWVKQKVPKRHYETSYLRGLLAPSVYSR
ncbi:2-amino-4-hydroxy-6-hydroxymethyldihydropteridine diphosphokinase [bacterium]|nr:2-amino-4-hydroxy-6-hydroxymethyldihydropteridine diphosphokinase [bacterium]